MEVFPASEHLIVAGAGHVSEPVVNIGKMLGFYVAVMDDLEMFANEKRFPLADQVFCQSYLDFFSEVIITQQTYILLLTRGHQFDVIGLRQLLSRREQAAYIGMISSKRRRSGVFEQLKHEFSLESHKNIYTPVGLDIGAQSPAEIAISIMAEILKVRNQRTGTKMFIFPNGELLGTIGGGCGEAGVVQEALKVMEIGVPTNYRVDLAAGLFYEDGGICGGIMDVFIEPI